MFVSFNSNMNGVINGAGTAKPSGAPESTLPQYDIWSKQSDLEPKIIAIPYAVREAQAV
jgi:hypothetical protein